MFRCDKINAFRLRESPYFIFVLAVVLSITACDSHNDYAKSIVTEFAGKTIDIPDSINYYIKNKVIDYNFDSAGYKIICFIDSENCTSCAMRLPLWQHALNEFNAVSGQPIDFLMVMRTKKTMELLQEFEVKNFNYPITWDSLGAIKIDGENKISNGNKVFLLDANDSIIVIGNPLLNNKLYSLYNQILKSNANEELKSNELTSIELCSNPVISIGVIPPGSYISNEFLIENKTEDTLFIEDILKSCSCIDVTAKYDALPRDEKMKFQISFRADSLSGPFEHTVAVVLNNKKQQLFHIRGFVSE